VAHGTVFDGPRLRGFSRDVRLALVISRRSAGSVMQGRPVAGAQVNVVGTVNILEAARGRMGIKRIAYASSIACIRRDGRRHGANAYAYGRLQIHATSRSPRYLRRTWSVHSFGSGRACLRRRARPGTNLKTTAAILAAARASPMGAVLGRCVMAPRAKTRAPSSARCRAETGAAVSKERRVCPGEGACDLRGLRIPRGSRSETIELPMHCPKSRCAPYLGDYGSMPPMKASARPTMISPPFWREASRVRNGLG